MEGIISTNFNICRVCMADVCCKSSSEESDLDLSAGSSSGRCADESVHKIIDDEIAREIFEYSGVKVRTNDGFPNKICGNCLELLHAAVNFKNICRKSNEVLNREARKDLIKTAKITQQMMRLLLSPSNGNHQVSSENCSESTAVIVAADGDGADREQFSNNQNSACAPAMLLEEKEKHADAKAKPILEDDPINKTTLPLVLNKDEAKDLIEKLKRGKQLIHLLFAPCNGHHQVSSENCSESTDVKVAADGGAADCKEFPNKQSAACTPQILLEEKEKHADAKAKPILEDDPINKTTLPLVLNKDEAKDQVSSENCSESTVVEVAADGGAADCKEFPNNQSAECTPQMLLEQMD